LRHAARDHRAVGVCGSDVHYYQHGRIGPYVVREPLILGHESAGRIAALGLEVSKHAVGQRVTLEPGVPCGRCRECRAGRYNLCPDVVFFATPPIDGAFANYVTIHEDFAFALPDELSDDVGALMEPLSVGIWACHKAGVSAGDRVLITGAGPIGLIAAEVCRHVGARFVVITDVSPYRLKLAESMGADLALDVSRETIASAQRRLGMVEGFDVALEMSGHPSALPDIVANLNHGGRIAMLGLPAQPIELDWGKVVTHMITIKGIYGREMYETWYAMSAMLRSGLDISSVITHRLPAAEWAEAFATARGGQCGKVVMDWSDV